MASKFSVFGNLFRKHSPTKPIQVFRAIVKTLEEGFDAARQIFI
jgi:hypothetical protein